MGFTEATNRLWLSEEMWLLVASHIAHMSGFAFKVLPSHDICLLCLNVFLNHLTQKQKLIM